MSRIRIMALLLMMLIASEVMAQQEQFNKITDKSNSSFGYISTIAQDHLGYVWFCSSIKGLVRFDGKVYVNFKNNPENPKSIPTNDIASMQVDASGVLWLASFDKGLISFDPSTNTFKNFRHSKNDSTTLMNDTLTSIFIDRDGGIWIGSYGGIEKFDPLTGKFTHYRLDIKTNIPQQNTPLFQITEDKAGNLWLAFGEPFGGKPEFLGGLYQFEKNTGKFTHYKADPKNPNGLLNPNVTAVFEDSKGILWVGSKDNGLYQLDRKTGLFTRYPYDPSNPTKLSALPHTKIPIEDFISFIVEDKQGKIWIGSFLGGLNCYDPKSQNNTHYGAIRGVDGKLIFSKDTLSGFNDYGAIRHLLTQDGKLWIVSLDGNLFVVNNGKTKIPYYDYKESVNSFYLEPDGNTLWFGTENGFVRENLKTKQKKIWKNDPKNNNSLNNNLVVDIIPDEAGKLWIATHHGGLDYFDPVTEKFQHYKHDRNIPGSIGMDSLHTVFIENEKYLWVGAEVGLTRLDRITGKFTTYKHNQDDSSSISNGSVFKLTKDNNGSVWMATSTGLENFEASTGKFIHHLPNYSVKAVYKSADGKLWAGATQGLFLLDSASGQFKSYTPENLPSGIEEILNIISDKENKLWISTSNSVIRLNTDTKIAKVYSADYGILSSSWNWLNNYVSSDGRIFIGGTKGYYMINPSEMVDNATAPTLNFSKLKISNKEIFPDENGILTKPIWNTKQIILSHEQNAFTLDFNAIDLNSNSPIKYLYQLADFEKDWHDISAEHSASYYGVPPGKYTLHVKAINAEGSMVQKSMEIIITPPWWQTWWAYTLYTILFILLGWGIYKFQKNYILSRERKRSQERELAQAKEIEKAYTELKATQMQLIQAEKMASLGELTAGIAHEIQNPLNFVNNFAELNVELIEELKNEQSKDTSERSLQAEHDLLSDISNNLEKITFHGKRADAIVKGMLQHSRSSTGQKEPTSINALADEYLRLAYHGLRARDKSFNAIMKTDFDDSIGEVNIIPQDIGRVILNLITNAFYAVDEKKKQDPENYEPTVTIKTTLNKNKSGEKTGISISVSDNGKGIPAEVQSKIFQPFFSTKPTGHGTGLGLSISYDIIKAHGGELKMDTRSGAAAGQTTGTTFTIELPL